MVPVRFEFKPNNERVNMRVLKDLLDRVKKRPAKADLCQRFIRRALETAVAEA
jgi:predicted DNA binding CopG/RHH family protein